MTFLRLIFSVLIAATSLVQCVNPQSNQTRPVGYSQGILPASVPSSYETAIAPNVSQLPRDSRADFSHFYSNVGSPSISETHIHYYTNVSGNQVQAPTHYNAPPVGACAQCEDGTYSFSQNRRGTCSRHGGVRVWLK
jgi:hypothetical protein